MARLSRSVPIQNGTALLPSPTSTPVPTDSPTAVPNRSVPPPAAFAPVALPRIDLRRRYEGPELMDDLDITDARLTIALADLRRVGRFLGGEGPSLAALAEAIPVGASARVLDIGTGSADFAEAAVRWGARTGRDIRAEGVDVNPATLAVAAEWLDRSLAPDLRRRVTLREADAFALPYADGAFDVAHAGLFLHHFDEAAAPRILAEMGRVARVVVVNDLHRHALAFHAIRVIARLSRSEMFRHDAPVSVARGFTGAELDAALATAGLTGTRRWRWAFRWLVTAHRR